jgi:Rod binding domain-containing protein
VSNISSNSIALQIAQSKASPTAHQKLVQQTSKWVALSMFGPMLKQMRNSPFHSDLLDGGQGGKAYQSMYDQELATRMTSGAGKKLVNGIVRRIEAKKAYAVHQKTSGLTKWSGHAATH